MPGGIALASFENELEYGTWISFPLASARKSNTGFSNPRHLTMFFKIEHSTAYRYRQAVEFTPHLLRLIPRVSPGLHLVRSALTVSPQASVRWMLDAEENIIGTATFAAKGDRLVISSIVVVEQQLTNPFDFLLDERAMHLPISYTAREVALLSPYLGVQEARNGRLQEWLRPFISDAADGVSAGRAATLTFLISLNRSVATMFRYTQRLEYGVQSPADTISRGEGTCRDFALLVMEAARSLGIAARYVSGYLCTSAGTGVAESHTHGWCELYLPGAGWRGFDPTNGILAGAHHIPVATAVMAGEIPPVEGGYLGAAGECIRHEVSISATELQPWEKP
jgi:transglutaminase-like putative cysteine protease